MKHKKLLLMVGAVVLVLVVILVALPFFIDLNSFKPTIEAKLSQALGREVHVGALHLSLLAGGVSAEDLSIAEDPAYGNAPFLQAKSLDVGVNLVPLIFSHSMNVNSITLRQPSLRLVHGTQGRWNFSSIGAATGNQTPPKARGRQANTPPAGNSSAQDFSIGTLRIIDGAVSVANAANPSRVHEYQKVQLKAKDIGYTSAMPFTFEAETPGGGSLKLQGKAGPLNRLDSAETPLNAVVTVKHLDIASTGFVDGSSGLAGVIDFDGTLKSDGENARTEGNVKADKLRLVKGGAPARQPVNFEYATDYDLKRQQGALRKGTIRTGHTAATLAGNYGAQGGTTVVHMKLNGNSMPVQEVAGLLPALGVVLPAGSSLQGGTVSANLSIDGPIDHLVVTGPLNVANTRLAGFNLGSKMSALSALSGMHTGNETDIQTLSSNLRVAPEGIRAENLNLIIPALGSIVGSGTIGANNGLNFRMTAKLARGGGLLGGLSGLSTLGRNAGELPFLIQGTTSNPVFVPDVGRAIGNSVTAPAQGLGGLFGGIFKKKTPH